MLVMYNEEKKIFPGAALILCPAKQRQVYEKNRDWISEYQLPTRFFDRRYVPLICVMGRSTQGSYSTAPIPDIIHTQMNNFMSIYCSPTD